MPFVIRELWAVLMDAWQVADLCGHLRAWWEVVRGKWVFEQPVQPTGASAGFKQP
jgi:hypothetical protein